MSRGHVLGLPVFGLVCVGSMLVAGCGEAPSPVEERLGAAAAPPGGGGTMPPFDPCAGHAGGAPDATLTMGVNVTEKEQQLAAPPVPPLIYLSQSCPARVVDVLIPSTSSPKASDCTPNGCYDTVEIAAGAGSFPGSSLDPDSDYFYLPTTSSSCAGYRHFVRLYKKLAGESAFTYVRQFNYRGTWANGFCTVKDPSPPFGQGPYFPNDLAAPQKPPSGTDTYRVVASVEIGFYNYIPIRFKAAYEPINRMEM